MRTTIIMTLLVASALVSCKKKQANTIQDNMTQGTWRISSYVDGGVVETDTWYGDTFVFSKEGSFTVSGTHSTSGTWFVQREEGDEDDKRTHLEFVMTLRGDVVEDLSEDWHVMDFSDTELKLVDRSGGNGMSDYLTFVKN